MKAVYRAQNDTESLEVAGRTIKFWGACYGNVDGHREILRPGCASKHLANRLRANLLKLKFSHYKLLGPIVAAEEMPQGIRCTGVVSDARELDLYVAHAQSKALAHASIGFYSILDETNRDTGIVEYQEILPFEFSLTDMPANEQCAVIEVKSLGEIPAAPFGERPLGATTVPTYAPWGVDMLAAIEKQLAAKFVTAAQFETLRDELRKSIEPGEVTIDLDAVVFSQLQALSKSLLSTT
jgi:HK97 family phage prohead protease